MTFREALRSRDFVLTGHLNLSQVTDADLLFRQAERLRPVIDAVHLAESDRSQPQMSSLAAAALLAPENIDPILHVSCRDQGLVALQRDVFGVAACGASSVMVTRGKNRSRATAASSNQASGTSAKELLAFIKAVRESDPPLLSPDFLVGTNAVIFDAEENWKPENLIQKCDLGANFFQLQLCFDVDRLRSYMSRLVAAKLTHRASFFAALSPLPSAAAARYLRDNIKAAIVPDTVIERLDGAADPEREGVEICAEMLSEIVSVPGISGASMLATGGARMIVDAIEQSGIRA